MDKTISGPVNDAIVNGIVNNAIYDELGDRWYDADDDPVALLRAESRLRNPWLAQKISQLHAPAARVLDVGCGAGFLSNDLVREGFEVIGLDASKSSIEVAARRDATGRAQYVLGDALHMPFSDAAFDVVCAMDFLEHVEEPGQAIAEIARVLKPGGTFFFHTFNRNPLAWLVIIKGVEWFVRHTPERMHILRLFIKPRELVALCQSHGIEVRELRGSRPVVFSWAFWRMLRSGVVPADFRFRFCRSTLLGYTGCAQRQSPQGCAKASASSGPSTRWASMMM
jgi:2-polyprenyl-6-hydroxyphenyl methylase/3-demethylubiquinone-9 3-methyltransferase